MCGINGFILKKTQSKPQIDLLLSKMNQEIIHRGPDEDGFHTAEGINFSLGMAMRRLSIIDLNTGKQPIYSEDKSLVIVFNGEIYNFKSLKEDLFKQNFRFKTTSDTEVILKLYEAYGTASFGMLDGMFAFSIYDQNLKKVFIARDFFGEKPLYYTSNEEGFFWASELKSLIKIGNKKPAISDEGLNLYFQLTYIPAPFTIYEEIFKLEANHFLEIDCESLSQNKKEIDQNFKPDIDPEIPFSEAKKITYDLVNQSVSSRSVSDVPIGTFLSGGVDSSIVSLALARQKDLPIDTFSVGFEKKSFDESAKSRQVADLIKSKHHEFIISVVDLRDNIDSILLNFDEPFADSSSLPTYLVAHKTRQHVKVALTGDGGDEMFGGYNKYYMGKLNSSYTRVIPQSLHMGIKKLAFPVLSTSDDKRGSRFKIKKLLNAINYGNDFYYNIISLSFKEQELQKLLRNEHVHALSLNYYKEKTGKVKSLSDFRNIDRLISLEGDMLVKVDRTSMLTSLESRAPFLNKKIWNFTSQLPEDFLLKGWSKKHILKEAFKDHFPEKFLEKSKKGFGVPVGDWLREHLSAELESYVSPEYLERQQIFNLPEIKELVHNHLTGKEDNTFKVWTFFCFQKWYKEIYSNV